jgi:REP element-mobilizing transposase RayT
MNATNPSSRHNYNPIGPAAYFLTFHTYGTWLHGDERGSIDRKGDNIPGSPIIPTDPSRVKFEKSLLKQPPVTFTPSQRRFIDSTIRNVCDFNNWILHAVNVRTQHIHVVITAQKSPESIVNSFKSWCTRKMRENGLWKNEHSPWSRHGSTRYLWNEKAVDDASEYVLYRQ